MLFAIHLYNFQVNLNHETVEDEETRNCFLRNFDKTSVQEDGDNEQSNPSNVVNAYGYSTCLQLNLIPIFENITRNIVVKKMSQRII